MISVNFTLLIQLANFLILLAILNFLLFKPVLKILDERERLVHESAELKEKLGELTAEKIEEYETRMLNAKQEAMGIRLAGRNEALVQFRKLVQDARAAGARELEQARSQINAQAQDSRARLMEQAQMIAQDIAQNLVGRKL